MVAVPNQVKTGVKKEVEVVKKEMQPPPTPPSMVAAPTPKRQNFDTVLADTWEECRAVRELVRNHGGLVRWLSEKQVNVINLETLGYNASVMSIVAECYCASTKVVKAPRIDYLKAQAKGFKGVEFSGFQSWC